MAVGGIEYVGKEAGEEEEGWEMGPQYYYIGFSLYF